MKMLRFLAAVIVLVAIYVIVYFILARPAKSGVVTITSPVVQGNHIVTLVEKCPDYRGVPERLFGSLHELDRQYFRSSYWYSTSSVPWPKGTREIPRSEVEIK